MTRQSLWSKIQQGLNGIKDGLGNIGHTRVERRRHPRYDITIMAQIRVKRGRINYIMYVKNVSLSGMFVQTDSLSKMPWFRVGQVLELDLFEIQELKNLRLAGRVVRMVNTGDIDKQGFGVEFTEMDESTSKKLFRLVEMAAQGDAQIKDDN